MTRRRHLPRALRLLALTLALALAAAAPAGAADRSVRSAALRACPSAALTPSKANVERVEQTVLCLLNRERARRGVPRLRRSRTLSRSAARYSRAMAARNFFSHFAPGGSTMLSRIRRAGYLRGARGAMVGENLAWGSGDYATPLSIVDGWMHSPGHKANILKRGYREIGIGVAIGAPVRDPGHPRAATYTTHFGARG
jgi:uncharacterized protein YkwD